MTMLRIWLAVACGIIALTGCTRTEVPVLDLKISGGDWKDYLRSLTVIHDRQTAEERAEFQQALNELKYQGMTSEGRSPGADVDTYLREKLADFTVRDALTLGHLIRLERKQSDERALLRSIAKNKLLRTKPDDEASANFLESTHANQAKQLHLLREELRALDRRIEQLNPGREKVIPLGELDELPKITGPAPRESGQRL
jgi:hypothetical protein